MVYRKEVDGFRALAVLAVIICHIEKSYLPSGYLGVDIFFVISGYVITASLYYRGDANLKELLLNFYVRRIKRLVPALIAFVVITSLAISLVDPSPQSQLKTGITALFGLSNLYLIRQATDYFGDSAQLNTFTHTWSLGVEEQFYLIFPILLWAIALRKSAKKDFKAFIFTLSPLAIISLASFIYLNKTRPEISYFSMPTRFWQLSAGAFAFLITHHLELPITTNFKNIISAIATLGIFIVLFLPETYHTFTTFAITFLSIALIHSTQPNTIAYKIFSIKSLVFIGLISYSLYLWHWGILSLSRWTIGISWKTIPFQVALMFVLAGLSYRYIEYPLRKANWSKSRIFTIGCGLVSVTITSIFIIFLLKPLKGKLYTGKRPNMAAVGVSTLTDTYSVNGSKFIWRGHECVLSDNNQVGKIISPKSCSLGNFEEAKHRVLVIGNSFSAAFTQAFDGLVERDGFSIIITSSWGASVVKEIENNTTWDKANDYYWETVIPSLIRNLKPGDWVFMVNDMQRFSPQKPSSGLFKELTILERGLEAFAGRLKKREIRLAILHGLPFAREANCEPQAFAIKQWFTPLGVQGPCKFITKEETLHRRVYLSEKLTRLEKLQLIHVIDLMNLFCEKEVCDYQSKNGKILYRDVWSHPSVEAARLSAGTIRKILTNPIDLTPSN